MGKKRKTRQQKIILQLKRKLAAQQQEKNFLETEKQIRQGAVSYRPIVQTKDRLSIKKQDNLTLSYDPKLVRKDIFKTLILSLIIASLQIVLYLKLR